MKKYVAEFIGTFVLVFCGTGSIVLNDTLEGMLGDFGIGVVFGLSVTVMIYCYKHISGAHINPAVTIGFAITDLFDNKDLFGYIVAQILGGILASVSLYLLVPSHEKLGATEPHVGIIQTFVLEFFLTLLLMLVIIFVSQNKKWASATAIAVGGIVFLEAWLAGPFTGASMNPARSIAPALISGQLSTLWIYILAPILGSLAAVGIWLFTIRK
ncbi:MAG: MIP/aquaporin family protein [bacterium]